jgi:hypothetical protein
LGERGGRDGADDVGVALGFASDQHAVTMARHRPGMQSDFAVTAEKRRRGHVIVLGLLSPNDSAQELSVVIVTVIPIVA